MAEAVNHPSHYAEGRKYEPIVVFDNWDAGFNIGNALKYISRAGRKSIAPPVEDLRKALFYLNHEINFREGNPTEYFHAIDSNRIFPVDIVKDWNLDENLASVVCLCFQALRSTRIEDRIDFLKTAAKNLIDEINEMEFKLASEAEEFNLKC